MSFGLATTISSMYGWFAGQPATQARRVLQQQAPQTQQISLVQQTSPVPQQMSATLEQTVQQDIPLSEIFGGTQLQAVCYLFDLQTFEEFVRTDQYQKANAFAHISKRLPQSAYGLVQIAQTSDESSFEEVTQQYWDGRMEHIQKIEAVIGKQALKSLSQMTDYLRRGKQEHAQATASQFGISDAVLHQSMEWSKKRRQEVEGLCVAYQKA